ncbi:hypothetical protein ACFPQ1_13445 [Rhodocytophaga aerolata]|uniref:hypothetical protein n=1 Tax=Rhodocytophaga aerolata TaxID=455078 RepID=UPI00265CBCDA|nr:hypothetical protein [Rhodocytophaga aerolata]
MRWVNRNISALLGLLVLVDCAPSNKNRYQRFDKVSFCDLPAHLNKVVYIEGIFSGSNKDYMFLGSNKENCKNLPPLCLDIKNFNQQPKDVKDKYSTVIHNPQTMYLLIKGVGKYISDAKCGHLFTHNHAFVFQKIISMEIVKK